MIWFHLSGRVLQIVKEHDWSFSDGAVFGVSHLSEANIIIVLGFSGALVYEVCSAMDPLRGCATTFFKISIFLLLSR